MSKVFIIIGMFILDHVFVMNSIALYTGTSAQTKWIAPWPVLSSKLHFYGVLSLVFAVLAIVTFDFLEMTELGFVLAGLLLMADSYFIGMALKRHG